MAYDDQPEPELDEDLKKVVFEAINRLEEPERPIREKMLPEWKRNVLYYRGVQDIFWSEIARDFKKVRSEINTDDGTITPATRDKIINIVKAHGESIISALSASVPSVIFTPADAEVPEDIATARASDKLSEAIKRDNEAELLIVGLLYTLYTQSFVAIYNYYEDDPKHGRIRKPKTIQKEEQIGESKECPTCGMDLSSVPTTEGSETPIEDQSTFPEGVVNCSNCGEDVQPTTTPLMEGYEEQGYEEVNKGKECLQYYGPLHVKIPHWVKDFSSSPYLILEVEEHFANIIKNFPSYAETAFKGSTSINNDRLARMYTELGLEGGKDLETVRYCWLRPWALNVVIDKYKDEVAKLQALYPEGFCATIVRDNIVNNYKSDVDQCWSVSVDPTSDFIHAEPKCGSIIHIQDMTTETVNLELETIRFGIPETFVDPEVVDFEVYGKTQVQPGQISAAVPRTGFGLDSAFYATQTTTLSKEVEPFEQRLTEYAQFALGDFPSIYGGQMQGGSGTFSEYEMSRNQALQRLSLLYKIVLHLWKNCIFKAVRELAQEMKSRNLDINNVTRSGNDYVNQWIRWSELAGNVGDIQVETSDQFPTSWIQMRGFLLQLIQLQSPEINQAIFHPENIEMVAQIMGFGDFHVPGREDRNKQLREIAQLIREQPIPGPISVDPMSGQLIPGPPQPSVPIDAQLDDHIVHAQTCRIFLISDSGMELRKNNPPGWENLFAHYLAHEMYITMGMSPQTTENVPDQMTAGSSPESTPDGAEAPPAGDIGPAPVGA